MISHRISLQGRLARCPLLGALCLPGLPLVILGLRPRLLDSEHLRLAVFSGPATLIQLLGAKLPTQRLSRPRWQAHRDRGNSHDRNKEANDRLAAAWKKVPQHCNNMTQYDKIWQVMSQSSLGHFFLTELHKHFSCPSVSLEQTNKHRLISMASWHLRFCRKLASVVEMQTSILQTKLVSNGASEWCQSKPNLVLQ